MIWVGLGLMLLAATAAVLGRNEGPSDDAVLIMAFLFLIGLLVLVAGVMS